VNRKIARIEKQKIDSRKNDPNRVPINVVKSLWTSQSEFPGFAVRCDFFQSFVPIAPRIEKGLAHP
jgi:hypothetical protein